MKENLLLFESLAEGIKSGVLMVDTQLNIQFWNRWFSQQTDLNLNDNIGRSIMEVFPKVREHNFEAVYQQVISSRQARFLSPRFHPAIFASNDAYPQHHYMRLLPILSEESGKAQGVITVIDDLTTPIIFEHDLRESERNLSLAQEIVHIGSWKYTLENQELFWSDELFRIYGLDPFENKASLEIAIGMIRPEDKEFAEQTFAKAIDTGSSYTIEYKIIRPNGEERTIFGIGEVEKDGRGNVLSLFGTGQDITERKRAQEEREKLLSELEAKNRELEAFVYTVSHDLKTPLISMGGFANNFKYHYEDQLDERGLHYIARIQANVEQMENLVTDLLELSRIGRVVGELMSVPLDELVQDVLISLAEEIDHVNAKVTVSSPLPTLKVDRDRLYQALSNLIGNALKFRQPDRDLHIEIGCQEEAQEYCFHVKDNGIGLDPLFTERIFLPFHKLHPKIEGMGIGLSIVMRIIEYHGGRIWVESQPGDGAIFYFTLLKE